MQIEEQAILQEKQKLIKEREEIQLMKSQLSHDSAKLKQERQKMLTEKREIENFSKELGQASRKIVKEKIMLKKSSLSTKSIQELIEDESLRIVYEDFEGKSDERRGKFADDQVIGGRIVNDEDVLDL